MRFAPISSPSVRSGRLARVEKERSELPQAVRLESTEAGVMRPEWMRELERRRSMDGGNNA